MVVEDLRVGQDDGVVGPRPMCTCSSTGKTRPGQPAVDHDSGALPISRSCRETCRGASPPGKSEVLLRFRRRFDLLELRIVSLPGPGEA